jgi:zinc transport system substrate-binding protein
MRFLSFLVMKIGLVVSMMLTPALANSKSPKAPTIVVSIKPIHALVSGITAGITEPILLIDQAASPHDFSLTPAKASALSNADMVIYVGDTLEISLDKALRQLPTTKTKKLALLDSGAFSLRKQQAPSWFAGEENKATSDISNTSRIDPHFWLNPAYAAAVSQIIVEQLAALDPTHSTQYRTNGTKLAAQLDTLDKELEKELALYVNAPFLVYHDALQYFATRFSLPLIGAVTVNPDQTPSAKHIAAMEKALSEKTVFCIFGEAPTPAPIVTQLAEKFQLSVGVLDTEWGLLPTDPAEQLTGAGPYFLMMEHIVHNLTQCLNTKVKIAS